MSSGNGKAADDDLSVRIGDKLYDLRPLADPPVGLWELLEKRGLLGPGGEVKVEGMSAGFDFLHCALCATTGYEGIEAMINGEPPIPRSVVTSIPGSQFASILERVSRVFGRDFGDATKVRPTPRRSSTPRTPSRARTDGPSETSGH